MSRHHFFLLTCLVLTHAQTPTFGQGVVRKNGEESGPAVRSTAMKPAPNHSPVPGSSALAFSKVVGTGGLADAERTTVRIVQGGRIVQTQRVGVGGVAQIADVVPGVYSVIASGPEGIAAYGISWGPVPRNAPHRVGLIPFGDLTLVRSLVRTHLQQGFARSAEPTPIDETEYVLDDHVNFEADQDGQVQGIALLPTATGQAGIPLANLFVAFIRGGQVVAQTQTDARGNFTVTGVAPGLYSLAVAGAGGFAAYSVMVIQPEQQSRARVQRLQFVAHLADGAGGTVLAAAAGDVGHFLQAPGTPGGVAAAESPASGGGGGGFGGGSGSAGGSGGGLGGGGLLGALAGAGIGAGIGAALAQEKPQKPATAAQP